MKSRLWIKSALTMTLALFFAAPVGHAQSPTGRTTLSRAIELIDAHLEKAQRETDADLKRRMQIEAYVALLSLASTHRQYEAADWLRVAREPLEPLSGDNKVIATGITEALVLAEARSDLQRTYLIDRQFYGSSSGRGVERQYFWQVMRADNPDAMTWLFQTMEPSVDEIAGVVNRTLGINWLCQRGYKSLARKVAVRLTQPQLDSSMGLALADLGATAEAEQRADRVMMQTTQHAPAGPEILARLAIVASRRGDGAEVERLVHKFVSLVEPGQILPDRRVSTDYGDCAWTLDRGYWLRWGARSIYWSTAFKVNDESRPYSSPWPSQLVALAQSIAGTSTGARSIDLIDQLIAVFDKSARENGIDMMNAAILAAAPQTELAMLNGPMISWHVARQSLILARVMAGGAIDDQAARLLSLDRIMDFLISYPHSSLVRRLADLPESERKILGQAAPRLPATLQFIALILEGRGADAQALRASDPSAIWLDNWRLTYLIDILENAGLRARAVAALDAYLLVFPEKHFAVVWLLMLQGQVDKARTMLREFAASSVSGGGGFLDVFTSVMLLQELGDDTDISSFMRLRRSDDVEEASRRLIEIADAFAWAGRAAEIEATLRDLPSKLAQLPPKDAVCLRDTLEGVLAVALSRRGDLERGFRLVINRSLDQRQLCWLGEGRFRGYHSEPIFDIRFLVQEWVRRGHAGP